MLFDHNILQSNVKCYISKNNDLFNTENNMSCSIVTYQNDKFYIISDRRITVNDKIYDNYQKTFIIPNTKIIISSHGAHPHGSITIKSIIESLKSQNIDKIIEELDSKMQSLNFICGSETYFEICLFKNNLNPNSIRLIIKKDYEPQIIKSDIYLNNGLQFGGSELVFGIINSIQKDISENLFNKTSDFLTHLMENIQIISNNFTKSKSIGGGYDLFVLSKNNIEHIQKII